MSQEHRNQSNQPRERLDPRAEHALEELRALVRQRYPTARFVISRGEDDPQSIHLLAEVDVDDPDEVLNVVIDRVVELQVDEQLPIHVIPLRTPERVMAGMQSLADRNRRRSTRTIALMDKRQLLDR